MTRLALGISLALAQRGLAGNAFEAVLVGKNEVPGPGITKGRFAAVVVVDGRNLTLTLTPKVAVAGSMSAHLHEGAAGTSGKLIVEFPWSDGGASPHSWSAAISEKTAAKLAANPGRFYVDVHTEDFPAGAARGQLAPRTVDDVASDPAVPVESVAARLPVSAPFSMPLPDAPPPSLQVTYYARVDCVVAGPGVLLNGTGTCSFTTLPPGETDALATSPGEKTFVIAQSAQTIDFPEFDVLYYGPGFVSLTAHASSGYRIRYQASGPCEIVRGAVKMLDNGFCTVTADQPGNWKFSPAPSVERTFQIYFPH